MKYWHDNFVQKYQLCNNLFNFTKSMYSNMITQIMIPIILSWKRKNKSHWYLLSKIPFNSFLKFEYSFVYMYIYIYNIYLANKQKIKDRE